MPSHSLRGELGPSHIFHFLTRSPSSALSHPFFGWERSPTKIDYRKKELVPMYSHLSNLEVLAEVIAANSLLSALARSLQWQLALSHLAQLNAPNAVASVAGPG